MPIETFDKFRVVLLADNKKASVLIKEWIGKYLEKDGGVVIPMGPIKTFIPTEEEIVVQNTVAEAPKQFLKRPQIQRVVKPLPGSKQMPNFVDSCPHGIAQGGNCRKCNGMPKGGVSI